jgi:hypothetical protein
MDEKLLDKYTEVFLDGIKTKLSSFFIEGRIVFLSSQESEDIKKIMKEWLTEFYNEANGQG